MIQILDTNYRYMTENDIEVTREIEVKLTQCRGQKKTLLIA